MSSLTGGRPHMGFEHLEPGRAQFRTEVVDGPSVRRRDRMRELLDDGTLEESDEQCASWFEHAAELSEGNPHGLWLVVDERVPGEDSCDRTRIDVKRIKASKRERHAGV